MRKKQEKSIHDLEGRAVLWPHFSAVVDVRGRNVGMSQPFLDLGDVGLVFQCVGGSGGAQCVRPEAGDIDFQSRSIAG